MTRQTFLHGVLVFGILLSTACSLTSAQTEQETIPDTGSESGISILSQSNQSSNTAEESSFDSSSLSCHEASNYMLYADHVLTVHAPETEITSILKQGGIALSQELSDDPGIEFTVNTVSPQTLDYEVYGTVGPCAIEATGTVQLSATGNCTAGIVYLSITEDWSEANGTISCDDGVQPFTLPGYKATHTGQYGTGEEFLIINDTEGYIVQRPFLEGDGYHTWTLTMDIGPVPLVPDGK
jgi:hypothetical protein